MALGSVSPQGCCNPVITESDGVDFSAVTGQEFNDIIVNMNPCCTVELVTSAGTMTLRPPMNLFSKDFKCAITLNEVNVTGCNDSDVHITLIKD